MVELPPICGKTKAWTEEWRSKSCKKILQTRKVMSSFKEGPKIDEKAKKTFEVSQKNSSGPKLAENLQRVARESREKILMCSSEKVQIRKFCAELENLLIRINDCRVANKKCATKRLSRPTKEMKSEDCPDVLLYLEKSTLKQSQQILACHLRDIKEATLALNVIQDKLECSIQVALKYLSVFGVRQVGARAAEKVKGMYCTLRGQKYRLSNKDVDNLVKNFCALSSKLDEAIGKIKSTVSKVKGQVNDIVEKWEKFRGDVDTNVTDKMTEATRLKKDLEEILRKSMQFENYYSKKLHDASLTLGFAPDCKHVREYANDTAKRLAKLRTNRKCIADDILRKKQSIFVDDVVMKRRKRDMKHLLPLK